MYARAHTQGYGNAQGYYPQGGMAMQHPHGMAMGLQQQKQHFAGGYGGAVGGGAMYSTGMGQMGQQQIQYQQQMQQMQGYGRQVAAMPQRPAQPGAILAPAPGWPQ